MGCDIPREKLWSWIDRDAPELADHLAVCPICRERAESIRRRIGIFAGRSPVLPPPPDTIGSYRILRLIGEGGQAWVYEAEQASPRRLVALKLLKGRGTGSDRDERRFRKESQALARLNHPAIATIFEAGVVEGGQFWFTMEKVDGITLGQHLARRELSLDEKLDLFHEICLAVGHAHENGVIHRDLKPSNILVTPDGRPKILDFGLARVLQDDGPPTLTSVEGRRVEGTPRYMSPEQAEGRPSLIDARTDVYSLGVILFEMLTGASPHDGGDSPSDPHRLPRPAVPPRPSSRVDGIDRELDAIVQKALALDPDRRYRNALDLADDLRRRRAAEPIRARLPGRLATLGPRLRRRRTSLLAAAAAVVLVGIGMQLRQAQAIDADRARLGMLRIRAQLLRPELRAGAHDLAVEAPDRYPGLPEADLLRAQAYCLDRAPHLAIRLLTESRERAASAWAYDLLLDELANLEDAGASTDDGAIPASIPDTPGDLFLGAFATLDPQIALARARRGVELDPQHVPCLSTLTLMSETAGDVDGALAWSARLVAQGLTSWIDYRIRLLFGAGRFEEALGECDARVAREPGDHRAYLYRARVLRRLGRYGEAVADLSRSLALSSPGETDRAWIQYHRGTMLWLLERPEEAVVAYRRAYEMLTFPTYANARLFLLLRDLGRPQEAAAALAEARERVWDDPWLARLLACLAGELSPDRLLQEATDPKQTCEARYYGGEVHLGAGRFEDAIRWFEACRRTGLESDPDEFWEPMSEYELAGWRLERLAGAKADGG